MLFLFSFFLVFSSSYFIASIFTKKSYEHFTYLLLTAFAQIVITFELLSLFSAINIINVLALNFLLWIVTFILWIKRCKPFFKYDFKVFFRKYYNVCKLDKSFIILGLSFLVFILGVLFLDFVMPITNADAVDYHVSRSMFYIINGSLSHFDVADARCLIFPFNSELIYSWILLLLKKEAFLGFVSFFGYCLSLVSIFKIMSILGFSFRKKIWTVFVISSLASVIVQISGTETDIFLSSLILSSVVLFWQSIREKCFISLYYSSLAYALAVGTKTTAIIAIPAIAFVMLYISFKHKNYKNFYKFCLLFILNFLIFSSYSYILNFIDFGNIMGTKSSIVTHKNFYGIKGMIANFIRHIFLFFDFSGFKWGEYIGKYIFSAKTYCLNFFHVSSVPEGVYNKPMSNYAVNGTLLEPHMSFGILGFLAILPCIIYSLVKFFFSKNSKVIFMSVLSLSFIIFLCSLSYLISFMNFNCRFLAMFIVIIAPVFAYSYFKKNNLLKVIYILCMIYYMVLVSSHFWARPWWIYSKKIFYEKYSISDIRLQAKCANAYKKKGEIIDPYCEFWFKVKNSKNFKNSKILYFPSSSTNHFMTTSLKYFYNLDIDNGLIYNIENYKLKDYDYLIFYGKSQYATMFQDKNIVNNYSIDSKNKKIVLGKKAPYYCFYGFINGADNDTYQNLDDLKTYPFSIECIVDYEYLEANGFSFISTYDILLKNSKEVVSFSVYKNMNK